MMIRLLDISLSTIILFLLSPVMLIIASWNLTTGEHQVFYLQKRVGSNGQLFNVMKYATMLKDSPNIGAGGFTETKDPRFLPLGGFLRKSKLNELPQLINVFKGDMSMVGYRPLVPESYISAVKIAGEGNYTTKPGITSPASIFFKNEEALLAVINKNKRQQFYEESILPKKVALDVWWETHKSTYNYFAILFLTALCLILPYRSLPMYLLTDLPDVKNL